VSKSLLGKLLAINILIIVFVILIVWLTIHYLAAGYFVTLMEKCNISPPPAMKCLLVRFHRYLIWASLSAILLALALSFFARKAGPRPADPDDEYYREIASGDYSEGFR